MAVAVSKGVYIVAGKRTPFGRFGGSLRAVLAEDLFAAAARAAFKACAVTPDFVDTVNIGQINSVPPSRMSVRHAALKAGVPHDKPALGCQMLSGSAFRSIILSVQEILTGSASMSLAGGMENLSSVPFLVRNVRFGVPLGTNLEFEDMLNESNLDTHCGLWLLQTGDILAQEYGITREECDRNNIHLDFVLANDKGIFDSELAPVIVKTRAKDIVMTKDEHPRPDVTIEQLSKLPTMYRDGVVTSGNVCGVNDGAAAVILCDEKALKSHDLRPLSRIVGWSCTGVEPRMMGLGPVSAVRSLLAVTGLKIEDMDLIEIHETYASQVLVCSKELDVDMSKLNLNGGAIAIGHPSGASGSRLIAHLTHELRRKGLKRGIATACIGGGQGIALLIESV